MRRVTPSLSRSLEYTLRILIIISISSFVEQASVIDPSSTSNSGSGVDGKSIGNINTVYEEPRLRTLVPQICD